jgi:hypothetical protein
MVIHKCYSLSEQNGEEIVGLPMLLCLVYSTTILDLLTRKEERETLMMLMIGLRQNEKLKKKLALL